MLRAMDIETVEFLVSPADPRFQGARYALNYVLVKYKYGGYTVVDGQQRFIQNQGSYNVYTRNTTGKMLYDLSGGFSYLTDSHYGREEVNRYEFPDFTLEKAHHQRRRLQEQSQRLRLDAGYIPERKAEYCEYRGPLGPEHARQQTSRSGKL